MAERTAVSILSCSSGIPFPLVAEMSSLSGELSGIVLCGVCMVCECVCVVGGVCVVWEVWRGVHVHGCMQDFVKRTVLV